MEIVKYPDGTSYVRDPGNYADDVFFVNTYEDLWHLNQYVDAHNSCNEHRLTLTIPNLIDAQADRQFGLGQSSGLKLVCKFLNGMDANFRVFHPHNPEVVEALMDNVEIIDNSMFIREVLIKCYRTESKVRLRKRQYTTTTNVVDRDSLILMSSDAGGFKPLMKLCDRLDWKGGTFSASKARTKDGMKQLIDRQDFEGKDILIIDDICVKGGTFKGLASMLRSRNIGKLYLAVSHMTVQRLGKDPVTNWFDKVFTTNSKFEKYYCQPEETESFDDPQPTNLEIIKLF